MNTGPHRPPPAAPHAPQAPLRSSLVAPQAPLRSSLVAPQAPLRPVIASSWERSAQSGLDRACPPPSDVLSQARASTRLMTAAQPVLNELARQIAGTRLCILLADRDCKIIVRVFDDAAVERRLDLVGAVVGAVFDEQVAGTNAIGTPVETGGGIVIHGGEHYLDRFSDLSCYGHPIVDPLSRRVEGILDITGVGERADPLFGPFLERAAHDIEVRLLQGARMSQQILVDAFQRISPGAHLAVTALGEDMMLSNRRALDLLQAGDHAILRNLARDLPPDSTRTKRIELASGELVHVHAEGIAGTDGGAVFLVRPENRSDTIVRRGRGKQSVGDRLAAHVDRIRSTSGSVAVVGEPGSGRTTVARAVAAGSCLAVVDVATAQVIGESIWLQQLHSHIEDREVDVLCIENAHLASDVIATVLDAAVTSAIGPRLILTGCPVSEMSRRTAGLVGRCTSRVEVPALRDRLSEFSRIAADVLGRMHSSVRLTPSALESLSGGSWPGNLSELVSVLQSASDAAVAGTIDVGQLPEAYRAAPKVARLAGRERAERNAITEALARSGGNKVHAAVDLGISRSTLYARMKALAITS